MTRQREVIRQVILESCEHMTAERIYELAKRVMPSIAVGTVYRNLGKMVEDGELMHIAVPNAPDRYDINTNEHEHLICEKCGRMMDIEVGDIKSYLRQNSGVAITRYKLAVWGLCYDCNVPL